MHLGAVTGYFRTLCNYAMNAKIGAAEVKLMGVQIFAIVTKLNVFVSVTKTIALFVLIMAIMVILVMFHARCMNSM